MILGLEYPPIDQLVEWPGFFNKIAFIHLLSVILPSILFLFAMKQKGLVPRGARNFTEIVIEFV
ncbi:MAG: ATP synthase F0 subunit A, partial [Acidimicrobiales bacterium]|nr:ATP synthase F0 subunit A [Acidimicrobiales bacterium]